MGGITMKDKIKIVLADDNKDFCQVLKEYLSNEDDIEILGKSLYYHPLKLFLFYLSL